MIIGLSGYSGSGKDTIGIIIQFLNSYQTADITLEELVADYKNHQWWLEEQSGWEVKKFAGKLKQIASLLTGIPVEKFEDQEFKKTNLGPEWSTLRRKPGKRQDGIFPKKVDMELVPMTVREFLQKLGTDGLRDGLHPNTWVNALMADYTPNPNKAVADFLAAEGLPASMNAGKEEYPNWIITDTRFTNEAEAIKQKGGIIIRVNRPGVEAVNAHPSETGLDNWKFDHVIENDGTLEQLAEKVKAII